MHLLHGVSHVHGWQDCDLRRTSCLRQNGVEVIIRAYAREVVAREFKAHWQGVCANAAILQDIDVQLARPVPQKESMRRSTSD